VLGLRVSPALPASFSPKATELPSLQPLSSAPTQDPFEATHPIGEEREEPELPNQTMRRRRDMQLPDAFNLLGKGPNLHFPNAKPIHP
jgi:hypothetical protein